ncbi:MAG: transcriptional repressor [Thermoguttaceae bacterium]|nr:transcriptional repressor [Thermoguttaceae bacterium]
MCQNFEEMCKNRGLSITVQRQQVYQALMTFKSHPTVDVVYEQVRKSIPTISRATVYRTLETLADEGLIQRVLHPGSSARYDGNPVPHAHLVCTVCGKTEDWMDSSLNTMSYPSHSSTGYMISNCEITFRGVCPECQKKAVG